MSKPTTPSESFPALRPELGFTPDAPIANANETITAAVAAGAIQGLPPEGLTLEYIEKIAYTNPERAAVLLSLQRGLDEMRMKRSEKRSIAEMSLSLAREVAATEAGKRAAQQSCEARGHRRPNGSCAIGGQYNSAHTDLLSNCVVCQKSWVGVGNGKDQLPDYLWAAVDSEYIGG